jgi:glycosyltransferase involved in cell wall biosynthesis
VQVLKILNIAFLAFQHLWQYLLARRSSARSLLRLTGYFDQVVAALSKAAIRLLIVEDTFPPEVNGASTFAAQLATGLSEPGYRVYVVAPSDDGEPRTSYELHNGTKLTVFRLASVPWAFHPTMRFALSWEVQRTAAALLGELRVDLAHSQSWFQTGRAFVRETRKQGIPVILTNHFMLENGEGYLLGGKWLVSLVSTYVIADAARTIRMSDIITTPTQIAANHLRQVMGLNQDVIPISCRIDLAGFCDQACRTRQKKIVFLGRLVPEKQIHVLLRAFQLLPSNLGARLRIIGEGGELGAL